MHRQAVDNRDVARNLTPKYDRIRIKLEVTNLTRSRADKYVDVFEMADGCIQVRVGGVALRHAILNPECRITHAVFTATKSLSAILAYTTNEHGNAARTPRVKPVSAKTG